MITTLILTSFLNSDWANHSKAAVLSDWRPSVSEHSGTTPDPGGSFLNSTRPLLPNEDNFPHYSYLSPLLASPRPASLATFAQPTEAPTGTVVDISPKVPRSVCSGSGLTVVDPSIATTTSSTTTLVGSSESSDPRDASFNPSGAMPLGQEEKLMTTEAKEEGGYPPAESEDAPLVTDGALVSGTSLVAGMVHIAKTWVWNVWEGVKSWAGWTWGSRTGRWDWGGRGLDE